MANKDVKTAIDAGSGRLTMLYEVPFQLPPLTSACILLMGGGQGDRPVRLQALTGDSTGSCLLVCFAGGRGRL